MALRKESDITHVVILETKVQKVCSANSVRADVLLEKYGYGSDIGNYQKQKGIEAIG